MSEAVVASKVKDVFSKGYEAVREDDTLSGCLQLFREETPPVLVVLDDEGEYTGVIARRWIIRSRLDPATTKVERLMRPAPTVRLHESLNETARLMIESEVRQLPVYSGEKLLGFVTDEDIIHGAVTATWGATKVDEIMTKKPFMVDPVPVCLHCCLKMMKESPIQRTRANMCAYRSSVEEVTVFAGKK